MEGVPNIVVTPRALSGSAVESAAATLHWFSRAATAQA